MLIVEDNIMFVSVLPILREFHQDGGHESWADSLMESSENSIRMADTNLGRTA